MSFIISFFLIKEMRLHFYFKNLYLFFALAIFLTACSSNGSKSITIKKSASEKEFETEIIELMNRGKYINSIEKDGITILWRTGHQGRGN